VDEDARVGRHVHTVDQTPFFHEAAQGAVAPVKGIHGDAAKDKAVVESFLDEFAGEVDFRQETLLKAGFRHPGPAAALRVSYPLFGQEEPGAGEADVASATQGAVNAGLGIFRFAEAAVPLPGDADGGLAFFRHGGFVDGKHGIGGAPEALMGAGGDAGIEEGLVPGAGGDELLGGLIVVLPEGVIVPEAFIHALHVLAPGFGEESAYVAAGEFGAVGGLGFETIGHLNDKFGHAGREGSEEPSDIFF